VANQNSFLTDYLDKKNCSAEEEGRLFHLLQFLSFIRNFTVDKNWKTHKIKDRIYYFIKFSLSDFIDFTDIKIIGSYQRKELLDYFEQLQKVDPIVTQFSNGAFRSYVCFPYVDCDNPSQNSWEIEILVNEQLFDFSY